MALETQQTQEQKIQSLQHSVLFLQSQHASTLSLLHKEIEKLQKKCSDLSYQLTLNGGTQMNSHPEPSGKVGLEEQVNIFEQENKSLLAKIESRDKRILLLEGQLRSKEQKYQDDLKNVQRRIAELEHELENKSNTVAYLTTTIQKNKSKNKEIEPYLSLQEGIHCEKIEPLLKYSPTPPVQSQQRKRDYNLRRNVPSPSASKAGLIQESSSHQLIASDFVLQNSLPKTNSTRFSTRYKQSINDTPRPAVGFSQSRREKELKLANTSKAKPPDYEDFIRISQPDIIQKSSIEPLPPITTRSGRQLRNPIVPARRSIRHTRATASSRGEVETMIIDANISSPERTLRTVQDSTD